MSDDTDTSLPDDPPERAKTLFAHFGRTYYAANCFETELANAILIADFLNRKHAAMDEGGNGAFDHEAFGRELDAFLDKQHASTAGQLVGRLKQHAALGEPLLTLIGQAVDRRNHIAHHFFREWAEGFALPQHHAAMLAELVEARRLFERADDHLHAAMRPFREKLGMPDQMVKQFTDQEMSDVLHGRRPPMLPTKDAKRRT